MIVIMTKKENDSVMNRPIREMADLVIVVDGYKAKIDKNRFGNNREILSTEIPFIIASYVQLAK